MKKSSEGYKKGLGGAFGVVFGIVLGVVFDNGGLGIAFGIALGIGIVFTMRKNSSSEQKIQLSDEAAEAMDSKIKFEAEQHRKNRDSYNYMKMTSEKGEWKIHLTWLILIGLSMKIKGDF